MAERLAVNDERVVVLRLELHLLLERRELALDVALLLEARYGELHHVVREVTTRVRDVDGRVLLVAREHPDLDARQAQRLECIGHVLLQLVLDGRGANELQLVLNVVERPSPASPLDARCHCTPPRFASRPPRTRSRSTPCRREPTCASLRAQTS